MLSFVQCFDFGIDGDSPLDFAAPKMLDVDSEGLVVSLVASVDIPVVNQIMI